MRKEFVCPVCGMSVDPERTMWKAEYDGETYYFCSEGCREKFLKKPKKYLKPRPVKRRRHSCCG